jgi:sulfur relay (sulfurtransferase) complex TusBCD TusD component (DsrE family)
MEGKIVVLVTRYGMGAVAAGDEAFGVEMLERFLHACESRAESFEAICFYTEGVRAVCAESPLVPALRLIEGLGVRLVVCRTCLDHYGLTERVAVGEIGTMAEIVGLITEAGKVVTL